MADAIWGEQLYDWVEDNFEHTLTFMRIVDLIFYAFSKARFPEKKGVFLML